MTPTTREDDVDVERRRELEARIVEMVNAEMGAGLSGWDAAMALSVSLAELIAANGDPLSRKEMMETFTGGLHEAVAACMHRRAGKGSWH